MSPDQFDQRIVELFGHPTREPYIVIVGGKRIIIDSEFSSLDQLEKFTALVKQYFTENALCPF